VLSWERRAGGTVISASWGSEDYWLKNICKGAGLGFAERRVENVNFLNTKQMIFPDMGSNNQKKEED